MKTAFLWLLAVPALTGSLALASEPASNPASQLILHEWGTFTVLQDESGSPIPGVNINEETLPDFVYTLSPGLSPDTHPLGPLFFHQLYQGVPLRSKGLARFDPAVTMRMETPIIYFHLPEGAKDPRQIDVEVAFRHGWISEWYPAATNSVPGFVPFEPRQPITSATVGRIRWQDLTIGETEQVPPSTEKHVWLAPRAVQSNPVTNGQGETERYLFYRGVANLEAPLRVVRSEDNATLIIVPNRTFANETGTLAFRDLWLVDIRDDGRTAFRVLPAMNGLLSCSMPRLETAGSFPEESYNLENRRRLRDSMHTAIVADGLYADEAEALLNTWEASYFKSAGLRLFSLLPREWTDEVLPLTVSQPADVERVMIGRIELVTPKHRRLLKRIAAVASHDSKWFHDTFQAMPTETQIQAKAALLRGEKSLDDYGFPVPAGYRDYMALGRFRDALVMDEVRRKPSDGLSQFARVYGLDYFASR